MKNIVKSVLKVASIIVVFYSCQDDQGLVVPKSGEVETSGSSSYYPSFVAPSKDDGFLAKSNTEFAFNLFKKVTNSKTKSNFMISPLGVSNILAMMYNGTQLLTRDNFSETLSYYSQPLEVNQFYKKLINTVSSNTDGLVMKVANSVWINNKFSIRKKFVNDINDYYDARISNLDFNDHSYKTTINKWVSDETDGKIARVIRKINANDDILLVSALYFNARWKYRFDKKLTRKQPFYYTPDEVGHTRVKMMKMIGNIAFAKNELFSSVILPYKNDKFSMVVLLPNKEQTTNDIISKMNYKNWNSWLSTYKYKDMELNFPKFKFRHKTGLKNELIKIGLRVPFTGESNFNDAISPINAKISRVLQKTVIDVNERGVEDPVAKDKSSLSSIPTLTVNRAFVYVIKENSTSSICFIGKVGKPKHRKKKKR